MELAFTQTRDGLDQLQGHFETIKNVLSNAYMEQVKDLKNNIIKDLKNNYIKAKVGTLEAKVELIEAENEGSFGVTPNSKEEVRWL